MLESRCSVHSRLDFIFLFKIELKFLGVNVCEKDSLPRERESNFFENG